MNFGEKQILPPKTWETFEDLCWELFRAVWADPLTQKHGRRGQPQQGVDVFGSPGGQRGEYHGVQCKGKDSLYGSRATVEELRAEVVAAERFSPALQHFVFATTSPTDAALQQEARRLSNLRASRREFTVSILGWDDLLRLLSLHPTVAENFYPEQPFDVAGMLRSIRDMPTSDDVRKLIGLVHKSHPGPARNQGWHTVLYGEGRGLGPALLGRPLGPADAAACPRLPEVASVKAQLDHAYSARLVGDPGSGKSICAYQVGADLAVQGWRVMQLGNPQSDLMDLPSGFEDFPTLYLIDDAHLAPAHVLEAAEHAAGPGKFVLSTHNGFAGESHHRGAVSIDAKRAVATIAAALRAKPVESLSMVRAVDQWVGDRVSDTSLESRIDHAEAQSRYPWQFCFVLGGGWQRAGQAADNARSAGADVVLAASAVRQIASRDAAPLRDELLKVAAAAGCDEDAVGAAVNWLVRERLLISTDDLRCPHQRFAAVVLGHILRGQDDSGRAAIGAVLQQLVQDQHLPLAGLKSLLHELRFTGDYDRWCALIPPKTLEHLLARCWKAESPEERTFAAMILSEVQAYIPGWPRSVLGNEINRLGQWVSEAADVSAYGLGTLLNHLSQADEEIAKAVMAASDPVRVAEAASRATRDTAYYLAELLGIAHRIVSPDWRMRFLRHLDKPALLALVRQWPQDQPAWELARLVASIVGWDQALALDLTEALVPSAQRRFLQNPLNAHEDLDDVTGQVLRQFDPLGVYTGKHAPTARMNDIATRMFAEVSSADTARQLSACGRREFQTVAFFLSLLRKAAPTKYATVAARIDWEGIGDKIGADWSDLSHEQEVLLGVGFGSRKARDSLGRLVAERLPASGFFPPRLAVINPQAMVDHVAAGGRVRLTHGGHVDHTFGPVVLHELAQRRPDLLDAALTPHVAAVAKTMSSHNRSWFSRMERFLAIWREHSPQSFDSMLAEIDPAGAAKGWIDSLANPGNARGAVAILVESSLHRPDALGDLARKLRARYPSASKVKDGPRLVAARGA